MQKKFSWTDAVALAVWLLPLIYLISVYPSLDSRLPLHFNAAGSPDRYGSKTEFLTAVLVISGISLAVALLTRFLPLIDPKKKAIYSQAIFIRISHAIIFLLAAITFIIIYASTQPNSRMPFKLFFPIMGLFFAYLGNLINNVKPNYFVGLRTPWTLESEDVWRSTHRLAGKIWLPGGIILAILGWTLPDRLATFVFPAGLLIIAMIPVVYSYIYYRQRSK
jgi:uncharacterized membrane protein